MSRSSSQAGSRAGRPSLYQEITSRIIAELEAGRLPWVQPWGTSAARAALAMPSNAATGRRYSGINVLILWGAVVQHGFSGQGWLTFRQALSLGGSVRRGERGTTVVFAHRFTPGAERNDAGEEGDDPRAIRFLKRFTVFNTDQCEGLPEAVAAMVPPPPDGMILPEVEALIRASGADLRIGGSRAYYDVAGDFVRVPPPQAYFEPVNWHRTALHELGHWAGAAGRLGRDLSGGLGSKSYAREELVAEMTAAFTCATLGIVPTVRHADYLGAWLEVLREDDRAIVRAASAASKAADYLLAFRPGAAPAEAVTRDVGGVASDRIADGAPPPVAAPRRDYGEKIARALATVGGHLKLGRGGATLYYDHVRLSGCLEEQIKSEAIAAGLPVIDSRQLPFEVAHELAVRGPMIAVGEPPSPPPYHSLSYAPLAVVAEAYRAAGAEVFNVPPAGAAPAGAAPVGAAPVGPAPIGAAVRRE